MTGLIHEMRASARTAAKTAGLSLVGGLMMAVGVGFMTLAFWLLLVRLEGPLFAASVLGCLYLGGGMFVLAVTAMRPPRRTGRSKAAHAPPRDPFAQLAEGFATGLRAGQATRRPRN